MKKIVLIILIVFCFNMYSYGQDSTKIKRAALDYIEGFYEGDTMKIKRSIHPDLSKYGYEIDNKTKKYKGHPMSYEGAIDFTLDILNNPQWGAPKNAVKKVEILDVQDKIANVKLTVYWGIDYLLLVKYDDRWMITKVIWQAFD